MGEAMESPVFAGREGEQSALLDAFAQAAGGAPTTVLLGGEAGAGKTRLVAEFTAQVQVATGRAGVTALTGGCLEQSAAGLPYAPFTAAVRQLTREVGTAEVAALLPGPAAGDLARLLPEFGAPAADPDPGTARARLFEQLLTLLERLAQRRPVILVVEDAHWADRSTRDLLSFLVRNLRMARIVLIVCYRSDDLHRTHPVRPLLAELSRVPGVRRLELPRLTRSEVAAQLTGILGHQPSAAAADLAYTRSEGIPLFVEAMVECDGTFTSDLPESLRDFLLAVVNRLPDETQQLLRVATASGARIGHGLLAAVAGLGELALSAALRPAVAANVLVSDGDGYRFRHSLTREAIHDDLLPGEHARAHRTFAQAMERDPALSPQCQPAVQLALHWRSAHEPERALLAAWQAAADAQAAYAYAEQLHALEQVLDLWDQVAAAARQATTDHAGVLERAARAAYLAGEPERGAKLARAAISELDEVADAERVAMLRYLGALMRRQRAEPGHIEELRDALRLVPHPGRARAQILSSLSQMLTLAGHDDEAEPLAGEALTLAQQLGDEVTETDTLITIASITTRAGRDPLPALQAALAKAERIGSATLVMRALANMSDALEGRGEHERAIVVAQDGFTRSRRVGMVRTQGTLVAGNRAEPLISLGRWDEAIDVLGEALDLDPPSSLRAYLLLLRGRIAVARGDRKTALPVLAELAGKVTGLQTDIQQLVPIDTLVIQWRLAEGDLAGALTAATQAAGTLDQPVSPRYMWPLLTAAARVCAEAAAAQAASAPEPAGTALTVLLATLRAHANKIGWTGPVESACSTVFAAEASRAEGVPDMAGWAAAASAWDALHQPYPLAYALLRSADAATAAGDHSGATARLRRAVAISRKLGARPLLAEAGQLARMRRIVLGGDRHPPRPGAGAPHGLTRRELEVLRLVTAGRSNREIAAELFITAKTASVHVSNILGKLGVATRGEAAAAAHRLRLLDTPA
jgi:ATP/maltotriose-dependent transcriptional regulator MalT